MNQAADAHDLVANFKALIWDERYNEVAVWLADDISGKISNLIAEMRVIRGKIEEMFGQMTKDLEAKLDDLLAKLEKNQVAGGSRQTLVKKQEPPQPPPPNKPIRVEQPGNKPEKNKAYNKNGDVPEI